MQPLLKSGLLLITTRIEFWYKMVHNVTVIILKGWAILVLNKEQCYKDVFVGAWYGSTRILIITS